MDSESIRSFYDRYWPEARGDLEERMRPEAEEAALEALRPLDGRWVLDVGAGAGGPARRLVAERANVVAIDISSGGLSRIRDELGESGRCFLVRADAHALPFRSGVFDRVALFSVLMFFRLDVAIAEFSRVLTGRGRLVALEPLAGNPFMFAYRNLTRVYSNIAKWHRAPAIRGALRGHFPIVLHQGFYLFPPAALLPGGRPRRLLIAAGKRAISAVGSLRDLAWLAVFAARRS